MTKTPSKSRMATAERCCAPRAARTRARRVPASLVSMFRALGDDTRFEIVQLLAAAREELCVCDIEAHFTLGQPTVSHHLRILREAGVVTSERRGSWVYYALDPKMPSRLQEAEAMLARR